MSYIHTAEYYSALKGKEILSHVTTCLNLEDIMLNKVNHKKTSTACFHLFKVPGGHIHRNKVEWWLAGLRRRENRELFSILQDEKALQICCATM